MAMKMKLPGISKYPAALRHEMFSYEGDKRIIFFYLMSR